MDALEALKRRLTLIEADLILSLYTFDNLGDDLEDGTPTYERSEAIRELKEAINGVRTVINNLEEV